MLYKHRKKVVLLMLAAALINPVTTMAATRSFYYQNDKRVSSSKNPVRFFINGNEINGQMSPIMYDNNLLVPVRDMMEAVGGYVEYNAQKKTTSVVYRSKVIMLYVDSYTAYIGDNPHHMNVAPKIIDNKLMVPLRFMVDNFGMSMAWDQQNRIAFVDELPEEPEKVETAAEPEKPKDDIPTETVKEEKIPEGNPNVDSSAFPNLNHEDHQRTLITAVSLPNNGTQRYTVNASSAMTAVSADLRDGNKLVLYINNSDLNVSDYVQSLSGNQYIKEIRYNNEDDGTNSITDIVIEFAQNKRPVVSYSEDRKSIFVDFEEYTVDKVEHKVDGSNDVFKITSSKNITPVVTYLQNPSRIVLDYPSSKVKNSKEEKINGKMSSSYRSFDQDGHFGRVVIDLTGDSKYDVSTSGNETTVKLFSATFKNLSYDKANRRFILKRTDKSFDVEGTFDYYNSLNYVIQMTSDVSGEYGYGSFAVNDEYIDNMEIRNENGKTKFVINEKQILDYRITNDSENIYISFYRPKELYELVVVLDPGHGDHDPGAVKNGLQEKDLNLDIGHKVFNLLRGNDKIKAYMTRDADFFVTLNGRSEYANPLADIFISIHNNSNTSSSPYGTEVYYKNHSNEGALGFSSAELAQIMQNNIVASLGSNNRGIREEPYLAVLRNTTIPASLCEIGFVSNAYEASLLADEGYRQKAAEGIYNGILEVNSKYNPPR